MRPLLATLPDVAWILIGCVIVAVVMLVGLLLILRFLQETRERLAKEIQIGIEQAKQPTPVEVQSPLIVKAHEKLVTRDEHTALAKKMEDELGRERGARKKIHEEIGELQGDVKVLKSQNDTQTLQLGKLDGKIDQVLMRLPRVS